MDPNNLPDWDTFYNEMVEDLINDTTIEDMMREEMEFYQQQANTVRPKRRRRRVIKRDCEAGNDRRGKTQSFQETAKTKAKSEAENASSSKIDMPAMEEAAVSGRNDVMEKTALEKSLEKNDNLIKWHEILMKDKSKMSEQQKADHEICCDFIRRQLRTFDEQDSSTKSISM